MSPRSHRREFLQMATSAAAASLVSSTGRAASPRRKNVLFIAVDDLRTSLGCYGDTYAATPNIDSLAARGTLFKYAYCQQAVCNPSRQSVMTGRRPDSLRVWDLKSHFRKTAPGTQTIPEVFRGHGYFAQAIGKIFHDGAIMADPQSWSVAEQLQDTPKSDDYQLARNHVSRTAGKADPDEWVNASDDAYPDGRVAKAAVEALHGFAKQKDRKPFFLATGFRKPHLPFTAPAKYWERYANHAAPPLTHPDPPSGAPALALHNSVELRGYLGIPQKGALSTKLTDRLRRGYYAAMSYTDAQIGRVLQALRETGLQRDTIVVFWADHGWHLGEKGLWCKTTNYEHDTNVPLIIVDPSLPSPRVCEDIVELVDIFPTLCDLCHVPAPAALEGTSLTPQMQGREIKAKRQAISQFPRPWFYKDEPDYMGYAVRTSTHRYVEWRKFGTREITARELYAMPPGTKDESENVADIHENQALVAELSRILSASIDPNI